MPDRWIAIEDETGGTVAIDLMKARNRLESWLLQLILGTVYRSS